MHRGFKALKQARTAKLPQQLFHSFLRSPSIFSRHFYATRDTVCFLLLPPLAQACFCSSPIARPLPAIATTASASAPSVGCGNLSTGWRQDTLEPGFSAQPPACCACRHAQAPALGLIGASSLFLNHQLGC